MKSLFKIAASCVLISTAVLLAGCSAGATAPVAVSAPLPVPVTQAEQQAMTPDQALARLVEGNKRFASGQSLNHNFLGEAKASAGGQYPFATVLSCIDSRSAPE